MLLNQYLKDGANYQARAVLAYLQMHDGIEDSWNSEFKTYDARIEVARWENCREQGYIVSLRNENHDQLNIIFFEQRNSDSICAVKWEQSSLNSLNIYTAEFGDVYKTKYEVSYDVGYGRPVKMAEWIWSELENHWNKD